MSNGDTTSTVVHTTNEHSSEFACEHFMPSTYGGFSFQLFSSFTMGLRKPSLHRSERRERRPEAEVNPPLLTEAQRLAVDALKGDANIFLNAPRRDGNSFLAAVAVAEMAEEMNGIVVCDALTGKRYFVPPGTPWQEALPAREK